MGRRDKGRRRRSLKGEAGPPEWLARKTAPVSALDPPWWRRAAQEILDMPGMVGTTVSIEDLTRALPCYPDGRRPRPRAAARRLAPILELVSRGPNGSLGKGASYRIVEPDVDDIVEHGWIDEEWIAEGIERMMGQK